VSIVIIIGPGLVPDTSPTLRFEYDKIIESVKLRHRCLNGVYKIKYGFVSEQCQGGGHMGPVRLCPPH